MFAVIFDMDGLMLDTERVARRSWRRAMSDLGFVLEESTYLQIVGRTLHDAQVVMGNAYGPKFPFQQVYALRQAYYDADLLEQGVPVKPGLFDLLDYLDAHGVPKAVASSTFRKFAEYKLNGAGLLTRFEKIVCGDEVTHGKPAPDIFLQAARLLNIDAARCVVLEDSEAGIRAAYAAGMLPVMVPDLKQPVEEVSRLAFRVLPGLPDVIPLLAEFRQQGLPLF
jgi:HAD superfamily hydrolase (TIGR01509 family)